MKTKRIEDLTTPKLVELIEEATAVLAKRPAQPVDRAQEVHDLIDRVNVIDVSVDYRYPGDLAITIRATQKA